MSKLLKSHKKFKFVLHVIKIIIFTLSINVNSSFLFVKVTKLEIYSIASLSDLGTGGNIFRRSRYIDFLIL